VSSQSLPRSSCCSALESRPPRGSRHPQARQPGRCNPPAPHRRRTRRVRRVVSIEDTLARYRGPNENSWTILVLPALTDFPTGRLAALTELDSRTIQRITKRATSTPHDGNRALLTLITGQLATQQLEGWGITPPTTSLEQLATYLDHRQPGPPASSAAPDSQAAKALLPTVLQQTSTAHSLPQGRAKLQQAEIDPRQRSHACAGRK
jgi:hypothetical protein